MALAGEVFSLSRFVGLSRTGDIGSGMSSLVLSRRDVARSAGSAAGLELNVVATLAFASVLDAAAALGRASARGGSTTSAAAAAAFFSLVSWPNFSMICSRV